MPEQAQYTYTRCLEAPGPYTQNGGHCFCSEPTRCCYCMNHIDSVRTAISPLTAGRNNQTVAGWQASYSQWRARQDQNDAEYLLQQVTIPIDWTAISQAFGQAAAGVTPPVETCEDDGSEEMIDG